MRKTGQNPRALNGTSGLIVGEVTPKDESDIVFARNRTLARMGALQQMRLKKKKGNLVIYYDCAWAAPRYFRAVRSEDQRTKCKILKFCIAVAIALINIHENTETLNYAFNRKRLPKNDNQGQWQL
jgi:hypothetical protein